MIRPAVIGRYMIGRDFITSGGLDRGDKRISVVGQSIIRSERK